MSNSPEKSISNGPFNSPAHLTTEVKALARSLGFDPVGVASAEPAEEAEAHLAKWLAGGNAASMDYLHRKHPRRGHPEDLLPGVRSVLCLGFNYYPGHSQQQSDKNEMARISRYALGEDYHQVLKKKLRKIETFLHEEAGAQTRSFTDSGPLLEHEFARRAGLGFIGRNTLLISQRYGSWIFLAEVLSTVELVPDKPITTNCGTCTACLEACPTGALTESFNLDARKCISYWTIEYRGKFPDSARDLLDNWLFGCDLCQDVCPFNRNPIQTGEPLFHEKNIVPHTLSLSEVLQIADDDSFLNRFRHSPIRRTGREGLMRNALAVSVNQNMSQLRPLIEHLAKNDQSDIVQQEARSSINLLQNKTIKPER